MKVFFTRLLLIGAVLVIQPGFAQVNADLQRSFSLALLCGEYGDDTGVGVELGTPSLFKTRISFRVRGSKNWLEVYKASCDEWAKYETLTTSLVYTTLVTERARGYIEFGTLYVSPDKKFSDKQPNQGITSSIGVELFVFSDPHLNICYYFSGGYSSVKAYAEKLENNPRYANGLVFNNGFRFYF